MFLHLFALALSGGDSLQPQYQTLDTTRVQVQRSTAPKFQAGRRSFQIDPAEAMGKNGLDLLRDLPSVEVQGEDQVRLRGSSDIQILLDGQVLESRDLQNLPALQIGSIEIVNQGDAKLSAEGKGGMILLYSRNDKAPGLSGNLGSSASFAPWGGGISQGLRYGQGPWNWSEQFDVRQMLTASQRSLSQSRTGSQVQTQSQDTMAMGSGALRLGADYNQNDRKWSWKLGLRTGQHSKDATGTQTQANQSQRWMGQNEFERNALESALSYTQGKANQKGWSTEFSAQKMQGSSHNLQSLDTLSTQSDQDIQSHKLAPKFDLWTPLGAGHQLSTGTSGFWRSSKLQSSDSISYDLNAYQGALYAQDDWKITPLLNWSYGLRTEAELWNWQGGDLKAWQEWGLYPSSTLRQGWGERDDLHLSMGRRLKRPQPPMVMPISRIAGPRWIEKGNPELRSEKQWNVELGWSHESSLGHSEINLFGSATQDLLSSVGLYQGDTLVSQYQNSGRQWRQGVELIWNFKWGSKVNFNGSANAARTENEGQDAFWHLSSKGDLSLRLLFAQLGLKLGAENRDRTPTSSTAPTWSGDLYMRSPIPKTGAMLSVRTQNLWGQMLGDTQTWGQDYSSFSHVHLRPSVNANVMWNFGAQGPKEKSKSKTRLDSEETNSEAW